MLLTAGNCLAQMLVARHPWYFETDCVRDALAARSLLARYLADHCVEPDIFPAMLVFGELMANVAKHSRRGGGVRVWLETEADHFVLYTYDSGPGFARANLDREVPPDSESGRGLAIVQRICEGLSYTRDGGGFIVRAVLPLTPRNSHRERNVAH
jgi:anti-sigma regulatory factor (Ser/Thr protein kinase)